MFLCKINIIIIFYNKNDQLQYIAAPTIIALISIYRAINQYIDYRDRPSNNDFAGPSADLTNGPITDLSSGEIIEC